MVGFEFECQSCGKSCKIEDDGERMTVFHAKPWCRFFGSGGDVTFRAITDRLKKTHPEKWIAFMNAVTYHGSKPCAGN